MKVLKILKYGKNNNGYLDKTKLHKLVVSKALLIIKKIYFKYLLLFWSNNNTNYFFYIKNII